VATSCDTDDVPNSNRCRGWSHNFLYC
jgi:hypothetical protein